MKPRGRPPSPAAREKALSAAHGILMEEGFGRLTVEAVAARSGVGKATIYRNWTNACELAMAALIDGAPVEATAMEPGFKAALTAQMRALVKAFATTRGRQIAMTLAAADPESEMTRAFRNRVILSSREAGRALVQDAVRRGEIGPPVEIEILLDMIYGPVFYRILAGHQPLTAGFAEGLAENAVTILKAPGGVTP
ncbi:TetR-like C-terminal domain-containing protein [Niveispirillum fermenti]|uniref:TetR-like C-terminal domain-containing protein n=1 Tax=Niveispirillum fermenti TaxID=1233113 RepID=UPI003A8C6899